MSYPADVKGPAPAATNALSPIDDKPKEIQTEYAVDDEKAGSQESLDYSGAHEKTDPAEIKLVRKLDRWIMPTLWSMYWLNYLDRNAIVRT
jgi:hypothetical protein